MDKFSYIFNYHGRLHSINVAIHNKNGQGFLRKMKQVVSTCIESQSTIKMDKVSYKSRSSKLAAANKEVAIHNKNGQGFLQRQRLRTTIMEESRNPQ